MLDTDPREASRALLAATLVVGAVSGGCSYSLGGTGNYVAPAKVWSAGPTSRVMVDIALLDIDARVAAGVQTGVLTRIGHGGDSFNQWRWDALLGLSHMPRPHEFRLGYEFFLSPGMSRYYSDGRIKVLPSVGGSIGLPLRLGRSQPAWRADDLIAVDIYLVPSLSAASSGFETVEVSGGLALRFHLWSAMTP